MFLLRAAFWLSVVVLLIPADPHGGSDAPSVGAFQALDAARAAIHDVSGFCDRNPDACATGSSAIQLMGMKARYGAEMLYHYLGGAKGNGTTSKPAPGTLTSDDISIPWHRAPSGSV